MEPKPSKPAREKPEIDPEHLLKVLDLQLAQQRSQRSRRLPDGRAAFRIWSLVLILGGLLLALAVLQWIASQLAGQTGAPANDGSAGSPPSVVTLDETGR